MALAEACWPCRNDYEEVHMTIRVLCYGLGPIGLGIARLAAARPGIEIIGAVDVDPAKVGRDLGELLGVAPLGVTITNNVAAAMAAGAASGAPRYELVANARHGAARRIGSARRRRGFHLRGAELPVGGAAADRRAPRPHGEGAQRNAVGHGHQPRLRDGRAAADVHGPVRQRAQRARDARGRRGRGGAGRSRRRWAPG